MRSLMGNLGLPNIRSRLLGVTSEHPRTITRSSGNHDTPLLIWPPFTAGTTNYPSNRDLLPEIVFGQAPWEGMSSDWPPTNCSCQSRRHSTGAVESIPSIGKFPVSAHGNHLRELNKGCLFRIHLGDCRTNVQLKGLIDLCYGQKKGNPK